ncbi:MAG: carboxypeptidase regulatory-like domain-containing protein, partial [Acidobacteria bacterium]|nr:carboxypeptidase regulatory-like domain-containing protein [Acidobacteriota bacterium]
MTSRRMWASSAALLVLLVFATDAFAQIDTGVIVGRVVDDSGAVLPGVTVVATQDGTGLAATSVTNDRGEFIFPGLRVGVYVVTAELQGFRRAVSRDVRVSVQTRAQVDL